MLCVCVLVCAIQGGTQVEGEKENSDIYNVVGPEATKSEAAKEATVFLASLGKLHTNSTVPFPRLS